MADTAQGSDVSSGARVGAAGPSVCFVSTSRACVQLLLRTHNTSIGGAEVQLTHLASLLARRGGNVSFVVADVHGVGEMTNSDGVRLIPCYSRDGRSGPLGWATDKWRKLWRAMRTANADVYVTRGMNWHTGAAALFARLHRRASVFWMAAEDDALVLARRGELQPHVRVCYRYGIQHCDAIVAQTERGRELMREVTGRDCPVIPNMWIAPDGEAGPAPAHDVGVLWVGNIRPRKRPELALEIAESLPATTFTIAGGPATGSEALYERVSKRASQLTNVFFEGHVPRDRIDAYYRAASLLLHTSDSEGFPNVLLEAWGHGLPVVSTFDPDGVIRRHGLGRAGETAEELAHSISELTTDEAEHARASRHAAAYVRRWHVPDVVASATERLMLSLRPGERALADGGRGSEPLAPDESSEGRAVGQTSPGGGPDGV